MNEIEDFTGKLLIAQPAVKDSYFAKSIILVAQHSLNGSWGVVINNYTKSITMQEVMTAAGIKSNLWESVYVGGPVEKSRVHVVHSLDWFSSSTLRINSELGITGDISVLAAISGGQGPKQYRVGVGLAVWGPGQLEGEQRGENPWTPKNRWLITDATPDLVFTGANDEQYQRAINDCVNRRISDLL